MKTIPLHGTLKRILDFPQETLAASEVADILGVHRSGICQALQDGDLEGLRHNFRGYSKRQVWKVSKSALVAWLWKHTSGDRAVLRAALEEYAPALLRRLDAPPPNVIKFPSNNRTRNPRQHEQDHPEQLPLFALEDDTETPAETGAAVSGA